ncbi:DUF1893 domain-containing protein [Alkaliphilus serpentinus]|nr:DUF1893 domain-containing protein [Alkaliphilus serpentinus]
MLDIELAKKTLKEEDLTCVMVLNGKVCYTSLEKGLRPLLLPLNQDEDSIRGMVLADRCIGKAAALLAIYGGIKEVYAEVISSSAKELLQEAEIPLQFHQEVEYIKNRLATDMCPMEKMVLDICDPKTAYTTIIEFIRNHAK